MIDTKQKRYELYVNGLPDGDQCTLSGGELSYNSDNGVIGFLDCSSLDSDFYYFKGKIDDIYFYNTALTPEEIFARYQL